MHKAVTPRSYGGTTAAALSTPVYSRLVPCLSCAVHPAFLISALCIVHCY
jgi:hypothetical protein